MEGRRPVRLNTTQHLGSQHLGLPLAFGKLLLSAGWNRAEVRGAGVSEAKGSCTHRTQLRSFLMTAPKIKALFYLFTASVFNSVQVPRGAPGPATSQHGPSSMAKLKQSDTGAVFGLQELCQVGKKAFFPFLFPLPLGRPRLHTHLWWSQGVQPLSLLFLLPFLHARGLGSSSSVLAFGV